MRIFLSDKFQFVSNYSLRQGLLSDIEELDASITSKSWKAAVVLAGSIIEALLVDFVESRKLPGSRDAKEMGLGDLVVVAKKAGFLESPTCFHVDGLREYRNLVHPGRSLRLQSWVTEERARLSQSLVAIVSKEIEAYSKKNPLPSERLLQSLEDDPDKVSILGHLLAGMRPEDIETFLISEVPLRYFDVATSSATIMNCTTEQSKDLLVRAYDLAFASASPESQKRAIVDIVNTFKSGSDVDVQYYAFPFLKSSNLNLASPSDACVVRDYLMSFIRPSGISARNLRVWQGLEVFLTSKEEVERFVGAMVSAMLQAKSEKDQVAIRVYLHGALPNLAPPLKGYCSTFLGLLLKVFVDSGRTSETEEVRALQALLS